MQHVGKVLQSHPENQLFVKAENTELHPGTVFQPLDGLLKGEFFSRHWLERAETLSLVTNRNHTTDGSTPTTSHGAYSSTGSSSTCHDTDTKEGIVPFQCIVGAVTVQKGVEGKMLLTLIILLPATVQLNLVGSSSSVLPSDSQTEHLNQNKELVLHRASSQKPSSWSTQLMCVAYTQNTTKYCVGRFPLQCTPGYQTSLLHEQSLPPEAFSCTHVHIDLNN